MSTSAPWNTAAYQRITGVRHRNNTLLVQFEDGSQETVDTARVLPPGTRDPDWEALTADAYEISIPTSEGEVAISWFMIRVLTDKAFAAHIADVAAEQARQIGRRIRALREQRGLTSKELAERAGITPQSLSRIEHGHHDVVFTTLRRIVGAMGCSLRDLATEPSSDPAQGASLAEVSAEQASPEGGVYYSGQGLLTPGQGRRP